MPPLPYYVVGEGECVKSVEFHRERKNYPIRSKIESENFSYMAVSINMHTLFVGAIKGGLLKFFHSIDD